MLHTSFGLFLASLLAQLLVPLIPGILVCLAFFPKVLKGVSLWLVARVVGIAIVIFPLFNLQFVMQTLGRGYYIGLLAFLFIIRLLMLRYRKEHIKQSLEHLKVDYSRTKDVWKHLKEQGRGSQLFFWIACIVIVVFTVFAGIDSFSFPTFADDAFGNWNAPALHIFYDGGVKMFGELSEILGRGRLGYPIHIPLYKAQIATMMGGRYEMGINVLNFLLFIVLIKLSFLRTWEKTKKAVISILPALLIVGLPLVFFHITDSYMEFPSAVFSVLTVRFLYRYLEEKELGNIVLAALFGALLAFTKNDGIIVYLSSIIIVFLGILLGSKQFGAFLRSLWEKRRYFWSLVGILIFFYFPFLALKMWYGLGYNQSVGETNGIKLIQPHWEIFSVYPKLFIQQNNYNIIIFIFILVLVTFLHRWKNLKLNSRFILSVPIMMFITTTLGFLISENYIYVMEQTVVNRVFTVIFIIFIFYLGMGLFNEKSTKTHSQ